MTDKAVQKETKQEKTTDADAHGHTTDDGRRAAGDGQPATGDGGKTTDDG